jgi:predicted nucleic acid-binding protein
LQYLLDTDICVDLLRGVRAVVEKLEMLTPDDCGISAISSFELFAWELALVTANSVELGRVAALRIENWR